MFTTADLYLSACAYWCHLQGRIVHQNLIEFKLQLSLFGIYRKIVKRRASLLAESIEPKHIKDNVRCSNKYINIVVVYIEPSTSTNY